MLGGRAVAPVIAAFEAIQMTEDVAGAVLLVLVSLAIFDWGRRAWANLFDEPTRGPGP